MSPLLPGALVAPVALSPPGCWPSGEMTWWGGEGGGRESWHSILGSCLLRPPGGLQRVLPGSWQPAGRQDEVGGLGTAILQTSCGSLPGREPATVWRDPGGAGGAKGLWLPPCSWSGWQRAGDRGTVQQEQQSGLLVRGQGQRPHPGQYLFEKIHTSGQHEKAGYMTLKIS